MYKTVIINQNTKNSKVSKQFKEMLIEKTLGICSEPGCAVKDVFYKYDTYDH